MAAARTGQSAETAINLEEEVRLLVEGSPYAMARFDPDGRCRYVNRAFEDAAGVPRDLIVGRNIADTDLDREPAGGVSRLVRRAADDGREIDGELRWGGRRFQGRFVPLAEPGGRIGSVALYASALSGNAAAARDLRDAAETVRIRTREAEASRRTLDALMDNLPEGIIIIESPEGKISRISAYGARIFSLPPESIQGLTIRQFLDKIRLTSPSEGVPLELPYMERLQRGETVTNDEMPSRTPDGEIMVTETNAGPIRDAGGAVTGAVIAWRDVTERKRAQEQLRAGLDRLHNLNLDIIAAISKLVEMRDPYTAGHQRHVSQLSYAMARELGLPGHQAEGIRIAGLIHDIGKLHVPAEILSKMGRLTPLEFDLIKIHPTAGYEILKNIDFPWPVAEVARQHQERFDGSGYPRGLKGDEILFEARLVSVADVVEAMTLARPYRSVIGLERALEQIIRGKGLLYDPVAVDTCLKLFGEKGFHFD